MTSFVLALYLAAVPTVTVSGNLLTPDGLGVRSGTVTCRLTTPGTAVDTLTGRSQRVASEVTATLTATTGAISMALVPNDAITPTGTRYTCVSSVVVGNGRRVQWSEQWQLASTPTTQDVGSVPVPTYPLGGFMPAAPAQFSPAAGTYYTPQSVTLSVNSPSGFIYYTTNGDTPTQASTLYSAPVAVAATTTIKALSVAPGFAAAPVTSATYSIPDIAFAFATPGCYSSGAQGNGGEVLYVARSSPRLCLSSSTYSACTVDQVCVDPAGALAAPQATNIALRSQEVDLSPWATISATGTGDTNTITVTANAGAAPRGTTTAEQLDFTGTTENVGEYNARRQAISYTSGTSYTASFWAKAVGANVTDFPYSMSVVNAGTDYFAKGVCSPTTSAWLRCSASGTGAATASGYGTAGPVHNAVSEGADQTWGPGSLLLADYQIQNIPFVGPVIDTTSASATAQHELLATPTAPLLTTSAGSGSLSVAPMWSHTTAGADRVILKTGDVVLQWNNAAATWSFTAGGQTATSAAQSFAAGTVASLAWSYSAGSPACLTVNAAQTCSAGNSTTVAPWASLYLGSDGVLAGAGVNVKSVTFARGPGLSWTNTATKVGCLGDSLTLGVGGSTAYCTVLATTLGGAYTATISGVGGDRTDQVLARLRSVIHNNGIATLVLWAGVNDVLQDKSAEQAATVFIAMANEARAEGMRVIVVNGSPWKTYASWTAGRGAIYDAYMAYVAAWATANSITVVDAYAALESTPGSDTLAGAYDSGDHLHLNQTGYNLVASLLAAEF